MSIKTLIRSKLFWGALILIVGGVGYWFYGRTSTQTVTKYGLGTVTKETIVSTVSGSGQVTGYRQLDVNPKASGQVLKVLVEVGDKVTAGTPLVQLDKTDALKAVRDAAQSVRDASISLESARLQATKDQQPADSATQLQAHDAVIQAQRNLDDLLKGPDQYALQQAQADIDTAQNNIKMSADGTMPQSVRDAYDQYVTVLQSADQTIQHSVIDADGILGIDSPVVQPGLTRLYSFLNDNYKYASRYSYMDAKAAAKDVDTAVNGLKLKNEDPQKIQAVADQVSEALTKSNQMLRNVADGLQATLVSTDLTQSNLDGLKSTIDSDMSSVNSKITSILNQSQAVTQARNSYDSQVAAYNKAVLALDKLKNPDASTIATAREKVAEAEAQLAKLKAGLDPLDVKISQNSLEQRVSALSSAQNKLNDVNAALADYIVTAPFDGVIAKIQTQPWAQASSGGAVVTMITHQMIATVTLNEVDVAKVKETQKATLTFDAIDSLSLTGEVVEVSPLGTVSQGVVSYEVKVAFDSQDDRIKSGMSVSVSIVTEVKADVLAVPNAAVKVQGTQHYVQTIDLPTGIKAGTDGLYISAQTPNRVTVEIGTANDTLTEITSGLKEGDQVITSTIKSGATAAATTQSSSLLRVGGMGGGGGSAAGALRPHD
jgi:HlyD family secretion protein